LSESKDLATFFPGLVAIANAMIKESRKRQQMNNENDTFVNNKMRYSAGVFFREIKKGFWRSDEPFVIAMDVGSCQLCHLSTCSGGRFT
jgi:hypothetical protein